ncbi:MAG: Gfo/Idh/MocA family oxidoreductase [Lentisphaerae bacterium]|nr:Gfo/Idh/MocA family oxidoreductase [Lentisphaerota bacterium]
MKRFKKASDIKVGVIGYGGAYNMGCVHLKEMRQAGMTPTAVVEIDASRLKVAETDFPGIETYGTVAAMLKRSDVNLLAIITPHNTHAKLALQCLNAGRHVVSEKPLAITTAECDAMIRAARRQKVVLSTYHNRHWDGHILGAMSLLRAGAIGDVVRVNINWGSWGQPGDWWRTSRTISGGILYDWGVHLLEYTLQMVGSDIREVSGHSWSGVWAPRTRWKDDTNEDDAYVAIRFKSGAWATMTMTQLDARPVTQMMKVVGTRGTMVIDWQGCEVTTAKGAEMVTRRVPNPKSEGWRLYQNVADHLTKGEALVITPEWSRRPIHILDLACQSARLGRALKPTYV